MSTVLNLFPARVPFVNADGTLTSEAYRAMQTLMERVGGPLGDNGVDVFGDLTSQGTQESSSTDTVTQPIEKAVLLEAIAQPVMVETIMPDVIQPAMAPVAIPAVASGGAAPAGGVGSAAGGYDTAVNRDAAITLLNKIRTALIGVGILS